MMFLQPGLLVFMLLDIFPGQYQRNQWQGDTTAAGRLCNGGCASCSEFNGCLSCKPRLFFHLEHHGLSEFGVCLPYCPRGHYGTRSPLVNRCTKCSEECLFCFSHGFCTRCSKGLYLQLGRCVEICPEKHYPDQARRECAECHMSCMICVSEHVCLKCNPGFLLHNGQCNSTCPEGFEADLQRERCIETVLCEFGDWSHWSSCTHHHEKLCGFGRGEQTRIRRRIQHPSAIKDSCALNKSQTQHCILTKQCPNMQ